MVSRDEAKWLCERCSTTSRATKGAKERTVRPNA